MQQIIIPNLLKNGYYLQYCSEKIKNDPLLVYLALKSNGFSLQFAGLSLQNDFHLVYTAVKNQGYALNFASDHLRNNKKIVKAAVTNAPYSLRFASQELRNDGPFLLYAIKLNGFTLQFASDALKQDPKFMLQAIKANPNCVAQMHQKFRSNFEIMSTAVSQSLHALCYCDQILIGNEDFIVKICELCPKAIKYFPCKINYRLMKILITNNGYIVTYLDEFWQRKWADFALSVNIFLYFSKTIDKDVLLLPQMYQQIYQCLCEKKIKGKIGLILGKKIKKQKLDIQVKQIDRYFQNHP